MNLQHRKVTKGYKHFHHPILHTKLQEDNFFFSSASEQIKTGF